MKVLTAKDILATDDLPRVAVEVPEWGGGLFVRTMTGEERDAWELEQYERSVTAKKAGKDATLAFASNLRARLVARTACDAAGALLFTADQADALGCKSAAALDRVFDVARKINRITKEDVKELEGS